VAMSTHGRSGVGRWLVGSIAEKVVQHSQDPVLLFRP
jgi:nucleotide-binding universal stress UspA family protein